MTNLSAMIVGNGIGHLDLAGEGVTYFMRIASSYTCHDRDVSRPLASCAVYLCARADGVVDDAGRCAVAVLLGGRWGATRLCSARIKATGSIGYIPYFAAAVVVPGWPSVVGVRSPEVAMEFGRAARLSRRR